MTHQDKRTWAEIDLSNLEHNYREIKSKLPPECKFAALCKANAYGHGAFPVAERMQKIGADYIAVSCYDEGVDLRQDGITAPILLLAPTQAEYARDVALMGLTQAVGDIEQAKRMAAMLDENSPQLHIHVKLETGMGRTGFNVMLKRTLSEMRALACLPNIIIDGVFTHFAVSDEPGQEAYTKKQFESFTAAVKIIEDTIGRSLGIKHCANSGAVVNYAETALDMVRPGILLYGAYGGETMGLDLRPVMELKSRVAAVTEHKKGDTVSYGRTFTCERDMRIAVLPAGYADGLLRALSNKMEVSIKGQRARQIGRICMDMCMIDVTDIPNVKVGDVATIFGADPTADEQAKKAGTISYELLCAVSQRVPRVYLG